MTDILSEKTEKPVSEEEKKELQYWIKRTYWDYLCAYKAFSKALDEINADGSLRKLPASLFKYIPKFSDFQFSYDPLSPASEWEDRVGHIKSPASLDWLRTMAGFGFKTIPKAPIYGNCHNEKDHHFGFDFGIAMPDDQLINGKAIFFDPLFACRYMGKETISIRNLSAGNAIWGLEAIALLRNIVPEKDLCPVKEERFLECICAKSYEMVFHGAIEYVDFTLCPLIERIRRYYKKVLKSDVFSKNRDIETLSLKEKNLRRMAQLRDECFAHNIHYPSTPDNQMPQPFTYQYTKDGIRIKKVSYSIDRGEVQKCMESAVMDILNCNTSDYEKFKQFQEMKQTLEPEKLKYNSHEDLVAELSQTFPDLSLKRNGREAAVWALVNYIASAVNLEYTTKYGYGIKKAQDVPTLLELAGAENLQTISDARDFRSLALHDHFPFEEFFGNKMMAQSKIPTKNGEPRYWKRANRVEKANMTLVEAVINAERENLRQQTLTACQQRKHKGGR